jgi:hypothetical protein
MEFYGRTVHLVGYWSVGLGDLDSEEYAERDNPMAWALTSWMRQPRPGRVELRLRVLAKILRVRDEWYRQLLADTVHTYFTLSKAEQAEEQRLLRSGVYGEVNEMLNTAFGRRDERVRRQAVQNSLLEVLRSRFPAAPEDTEARVRRVKSVARLNELIRRAAIADSLEELGL